MIVAELVRLGPDTPGGRAVIQRLNRIHSTYAIRQEDYAYVLSGFVAEPIRWIENYGWRVLHPFEEEALFLFWDHVGSLMQLEQRPRSLHWTRLAPFTVATTEPAPVILITRAAKGFEITQLFQSILQIDHL